MYHPCGRKVYCDSLSRTQINLKMLHCVINWNRFLCQGSSHSMMDLAMVQWGEHPTMVKKLFHATSFFRFADIIMLMTKSFAIKCYILALRKDLHTNKIHKVTANHTTLVNPRWSLLKYNIMFMGMPLYSISVGRYTDQNQFCFAMVKTLLVSNLVHFVLVKHHLYDY